MRGRTNVKNCKNNNTFTVSPLQFILTLNNAYESTGSNFSSRNFVYFDCPNKDKYTTLKVLRTECGGLNQSEGIRDTKCNARMHYLWNGTYTNINNGITDYVSDDGFSIYTMDISNVNWEDNSLGIVGVSGNYNTLAKVYFELS